jgi:hypothetical protein
VKFGKSPRSLLVLGRYDGAELHWVSADRGLVATRHGRLVRTVGFPSDLKLTRDLTPDPVASGLHRLDSEARHVRLVDIQPGDRFQVPVHSTLHVVGQEEIEILDLRFSTVRVTESNTAGALDWRFRNEFWADTETGLVWRSIQHFAPALPPLEIEVLKPAA